MLDLINRVLWTNDVANLRRESEAVRQRVTLGFVGVDVAQEPRCYHAKQVHGISVVQADDGTTAPELGQRTEADGIFTRRAGRTIGVQTADCVPVLLYSAESSFVGAFHAGWRGLTAGILNSAIQSAERQGCNAEQLYGVIGPCISPARFEVGPEVVAAFRASSALDFSAEQMGYVLTKGRGDRWHIDLALASVLNLIANHISPDRLSVLRSCSYDNPHLWYSYRRTGDRAGRIWSCVTLNK